MRSILRTVSLWGLGPFLLVSALAAQGQPGCLAPPTLTPKLPVDSAVSSQNDFNCFGWQEFIALNWKASPTAAGQPDPAAEASVFGAPAADGDTPAVVWQSYSADGQVFLPNGAPPPAFGSADALPAACSGAKANLRGRLVAPKRSKDRFATGFRVLQSTSKVTPSLVRSFRAKPSAASGDELSSIIQAGTQSWLTAQNGEVTYYEIRLNEDEYNYITSNKLYNANCQWQAVQPGGAGVLLPAGATVYGPVGAIEVKAAWLPLKDPALYSRYLTSQAVIVHPDGSCQSIVVGLVGLHIVHKTPKAKQLTWATFEHVDNDPDSQQVAVGAVAAHTYYNPNCDKATDPYDCAANTQPPSCGTGSTPPCNYAAPMQVVRSTPLPANVVSLNEYVRGLIVQANSRSVFQYYRLVNVMWPNSNTTVPPGATTPLTAGNAQPPMGQGGLANTTMETYVQTTHSCLTCHTYAPISNHTEHGSTKFASDYSFLFLLAQAPANPPANQCTPVPVAKTRNLKRARR